MTLCTELRYQAKGAQHRASAPGDWRRSRGTAYGEVGTFSAVTDSRKSSLIMTGVANPHGPRPTPGAAPLSMTAACRSA